MSSTSLRSAPERGQTAPKQHVRPRQENTLICSRREGREGTLRQEEQEECDLRLRIQTLLDPSWIFEDASLYRPQGHLKWLCSGGMLELARLFHRFVKLSQTRYQ